MESVFKYLENKQLDFDRKKNEVGKCKGNSSNNGKKENRSLAVSIIKWYITLKIFVRSAKNIKNEKSRTSPSKSQNICKNP